MNHLRMTNYLTQFKCTKLATPDYITAVIERRERDIEVDKVECDPEVLEKVVDNYVIVKKILSQLPWQDQMLCKLVCKSWRDAVNALQKTDMACRDFVLIEQNSHTLKYMKSGPINKEPLIIISFVLVSTLGLRAKCKHFSPSICNPACLEEHDVLDIVDNSFNCPKQCMLTLKTDYVSYMPLEKTLTHPYLVKRDRNTGLRPFLGGVIIPKIPDVKYHLLNIKTFKDINQEFYNPVNEIMEHEVIKGVLVFMTDKYYLHSVDDVSFLNHFKEKQSEPYAFGGCIIEDTLSTSTDLTCLIQNINDEKPYISENTMTIAMFTLPKIRDPENDVKHKFEMYSAVIQSCNFSKVRLLAAIRDFSERVPRFEHSLVFKLSCIALEPRHNLEQAVFRAFFPNTPLIGCYGNGELGINHPEPPPERSTSPFHCNPKRRKSTQLPDFMHSYCTVFVYFGWGKQIND